MKASGSKIIIKPRRLRPISPDVELNASETDAQQPSPEQEDGDETVEVGSELHTESQREDGEDAAEDEDDGEISPVLQPRGRGRGRGRGTSTGRPRGRPRGSGRGRGRGRGRAGTILLRLPKRGVDSDGAVEGVVGGEEGEDSQAATPAGDDAESVEPIGGGKPFRRIQGQVYVIENDEFVTEDDPKGDTKIDANGNLLGRRVFKAQSFILPNRHPERKYLLAIEAARTSGFRDSLYYFRRNPLAFKLNATQPEKDYLIEVGKLGGHLRTRSVTLITARSAYKMHGSKMIIDGKLVIDDYYEDKALADVTAKGLKAGDPASELQEQQQQATEAAALAAANKAASALGTAGNKGERGAGVGLYRTGGPTTIFGGTGLGPFSDGPLNVGRKALLNREGVKEDNWILVMAERTIEANQEWAKGRKEALKAVGGIFVTGNSKEEKKEQVVGAHTGESSPKRALNGEGDRSETKRSKRRKRDNVADSDLPLGVYEPHSGIVHYRRDTQPTRSRWEVLPEAREKKRVLGGTKTGNGAWALAWVDTVMELPSAESADELPDAQARRRYYNPME